MKLSSGFLATIEKENEGSSSADNYLRYTKLDQGKPANFALLEQDPLEYWLVWGVAKENDSMKPFRFLEQPDQSDIDLELGSDYVQSMNYDKTAVRKPSQCLTWPVYNWEAKKVQVLECGHVSTRTGMESILTHKTWKKMPTDIDIEITKTVTSDNRTTYEVMPSPRDDSHDADEAEAAYKAIKKEGFDLNRMVVGGDPFSEG